MKHIFLVFSFVSLFVLSSSVSFAATGDAKKVVPSNFTVTSTDCAGSLEKVRLVGLREMKARRDAALAKAKRLKTSKESERAKKRAKDSYAAEMNVAAKQLEAAKALCKKPASSVKRTIPVVVQPVIKIPKPVVAPEVSSKAITNTPEKPMTSGNVNVEISNFAFSPATVTVKKGTMVIWTNNDGARHTVTSDTNLFGSELLGTGQTFTSTFNTAGSFPYHCDPHRSMVAFVEVVE